MSVTTLRTAFATVFATATTAVTLMVTALPAAAAIDAPAVTDDYLFNRSLADFSGLRTGAPNADQLDWSSDGCSWSPDNPFGFKFLPACHRHDFGYRNYKRQARFTEASRLRIDDRFKADMYQQCGSNWACKRTADLYYKAVREFGAS